MKKSPADRATASVPSTPKVRAWSQKMREALTAVAKIGARGTA
jgi:hypothetical protein